MLAAKTFLSLACLAALALPRRAALIYSTDFDNFAPGSVAGQGGWLGESSGQLDPAIVDVAGHGRALRLQTLGMDSSTFTDAYRPFGVDLAATDGKMVTVQWQQYRASLGDNLYFAESAAYGDYYGVEAGMDGLLRPQEFRTDAGTGPLTAGRWQDIELDLDFNAKTIEAFIDGASLGATPFAKDYKHFRGIDFDVVPTPFDGKDTPNYIDNVRISNGASPVPEPGTLALLGVAFLPLWRRKRLSAACLPPARTASPDGTHPGSQVRHPSFGGRGISG